VDENLERTEVPHLWSWTRFNPGACLLAPFWAIGHRAWIGLLVPLPAILVRFIGYAIPEWRVFDFVDPVRLVLYWVPAILFGLKADKLAWQSNPTSWSPTEYRRQQRIWMWAGLAIIVINGVLGQIEFQA